MKKILNNIALHNLVKFCVEKNIDCSNTHLYKYPRRWTYSLLKDDNGLTIVSITFYKNQAPTYFIQPKK